MPLQIPKKPPLLCLGLILKRISGSCERKQSYWRTTKRIACVIPPPTPPLLSLLLTANTAIVSVKCMFVCLCAACSEENIHSFSREVGQSFGSDWSVCTQEPAWQLK